jgi:ABC-type sugar transport system ATPase subunit
MTDGALVRMTSITKTYPGVRALGGVDFELLPGEVHCLVGENGAGKSTLMRILTGAEQSDQGVIVIGGREFSGYRPIEAIRLGVSSIYQETDLVPEMTVTQNMFLGHEIRGRLGLLNHSAMEEAARRVLDELNVAVPVDAIVAHLTPAHAQQVQIGKALTRDCRVLIMDEPSAVLSDHELETLFRTIETLKSKGIGIVYISHRLDEILELGDRVTIMRDGKAITTQRVADTSIPEIVNLMVGRDLQDQFGKSPAVLGDVVLSVSGLTLPGFFTDINLQVRRGEIVGLAGLVGAGRTSLLNSIFGQLPADSGSIELDGDQLKAKNPWQAINRGIGLVPEDRRGQGLVLLRSVQSNITLPSLDRLSTAGVIRWKAVREAAAKFISDLRIKTPSAAQPAQFLSGGNQQKVVLAKWLARDVAVLLLDEPTVGVDIGAKHEIYAVMNDLASRGMGILMASSDMPEILGMSDRIIVMSEGRITAEFTREEATQEGIMRAAVPMSAVAS